MPSTIGTSTHPLEIKKSCVMRTLIDYEVYKKEICEAQSKFDSLKDNGDSNELKRAKQTLDESTAVLEHTRKSLANFATDLDLYIRDNVLPMLKSGHVPPMCKTFVTEAKKYLDEIITKYPEVGFKYPKKD